MLAIQPFLILNFPNCSNRKNKLGKINVVTVNSKSYLRLKKSQIKGVKKGRDQL